MANVSKHAGRKSRISMPPRSIRSGTYAALIHDCLHREYHEYLSPLKRAWRDSAYRRALRCADYVFLVSEFVRPQIELFYCKALANRSTVIYNAINWDRFW